MISTKKLKSKKPSSSQDTKLLIKVESIQNSQLAPDGWEPRKKQHRLNPDFRLLFAVSRQSLAEHSLEEKPGAGHHDHRVRGQVVHDLPDRSMGCR